MIRWHKIDGVIQNRIRKYKLHTELEKSGNVWTKNKNNENKNLATPVGTIELPVCVQPNQAKKNPQMFNPFLLTDQNLAYTQKYSNETL